MLNLCKALNQHPLLQGFLLFIFNQFIQFSISGKNRIKLKFTRLKTHHLFEKWKQSPGFGSMIKDGCLDSRLLVSSKSGNFPLQKLHLTCPRALPLLLNILFLGSLLYYSFQQYQRDQDFCYTNFKDWIRMRMYLLVALIICLACILLKASQKMQQVV